MSLTTRIDYKPVLPLRPAPIMVIGAGGIVHDAHLPAYRMAGFEVAGIVNRTRERAEQLAIEFHIPTVYTDLEEAIKEAPPGTVYDIALMPAQYMEVLERLPPRSSVLIQKPMGENLCEAEKILETCERKGHIAAINFQLRYAPFVAAARSMIRQGLLGELYDMEVRLTTFTPWDIFPHVAVHERLEILFHSIHYMDLIRSFLGNPRGVMAKTFSHPAKPYSSTRTTAILNYGKTLRGAIHTNHDHVFGATNQESFIKWEGTKGAIKAGMGLLLDYPRGLPDTFQYCLLREGKEPEWESLEIEGSWFPEAFIGTMSDLMRFTEGSITELPTSVQDVIHTMRLMESAYISDATGGVNPEDPE